MLPQRAVGDPQSPRVRFLLGSRLTGSKSPRKRSSTFSSRCRSHSLSCWLAFGEHVAGVRRSASACSSSSRFSLRATRCSARAATKTIDCTVKGTAAAIPPSGVVSAAALSYNEGALSVFRLKTAIAASLALACLAAAATDAKAQTRAQWASAANAICAKGFAPSHAVIAAWTKKPPATVAEYVQGFTRMINGESGMRRGLAALPRPTADRATISTLLGWLDQALRQLRLARSAERALNLPLYHSHLSAALADGKQFAVVADKLGAHVCAHG